MKEIIQIFIFIPLLSFFVGLFMPNKKENAISSITYFTAGLCSISALSFVVYWLVNNHPMISVEDIVLFQTAEYRFYIDFMFDKVTAVYLLVGAFLTFLIAKYSKTYLHRETGYKRFFNTIMFFYFGYNVVIFSGNFETLFLGWEIIGLASFLLITFYRDRYLPVKNGLKIFSIYRLGDVGLLLAMWMSHHLWHENVAFTKLHNSALVVEQLSQHASLDLFISLMILLAALAKSAQFPFSSWLPRAMEGPTPSSAIFYGSLSVHLGLFVLLRTQPFWIHQMGVRVLIGTLGILTSLAAIGIARVQSSVKSQIAYSSIAQIGIMFAELAMGFENFVLWHFAGNAFLRTYQLLVSPSIVSYLIREQFYNFVPRKLTFEDSLPKRLERTFYMLAIKEWNLDHFLFKYLWNPSKQIGKKLNFINAKLVIGGAVLVYVMGLYMFFNKENFSEHSRELTAIALAAIGFTMILKEFTERFNVYRSWFVIASNHLWIILAVAINTVELGYDEVALYLTGVVVSAASGAICLSILKKREAKLDLNNFYGHAYEYPKLGIAFLLSCLGLAGFPITTTFIGEDLMFSHIHETQVVLATIMSAGFIISGLALMRMYARLFMGTHIKTYHETAYRSS